MKNIPFETYQTLIRSFEQACQNVEESYRGYLNCQKGCSSCCKEISLLPVEWFALYQAILKKKEAHKQLKKGNNQAEGSCYLLQDGLCSSYQSRPFICRSHGLPLLYLNDEGDQWELNYCDLNFRSIDEDHFQEVFSPEDLLNMEEWNSKLFLVNKEFLKTDEGISLKKISSDGRIPIKKIKDFIK